jgi:inorganic pyrophosphatase
VKVTGWGDAAEACEYIVRAIERAKGKPAAKT